MSLRSWRIEEHLKIFDVRVYDYVFIQLPTPIRNDAESKSTTTNLTNLLMILKR